MEKVSIITPCYNGENYIQETAYSVLNQTYNNWEWIIVDDKSNDNSQNILKKISSQDSRVRLIFLEKNSGAAIARNKGLEIAEGEFIAFLDCDDYWHLDKLKIQIEYSYSQNADFTYHHYEIINQKGKLIKVQKVKKYIEQDDLLKYNPFATSSIMIRSEVIKENNIIFRPYLRRRQDYLFWYDAIGKSNKAMGVSITLSSYRIFTDTSLSANKRKMAVIQWRLYKDEFRINKLKTLYYFIRYSFHGFKKYFLK